ncbi:MAG: hypothetical protein IJ476_07715 [Bacteroidales bacterium]|nr:hypothetical protein [Bacteroidales bacterium]MBR1949736.1 hypothetical protein [Bacteroidales bacterium]MBR2437583.1 hypothetical protein [Bacteroidales bacterium]
MKRISLICIILFIAVFSSYAQQKVKGKFSINCKVTFVVDEEIPGINNNGVIIDFKTKRVVGYKYYLDDVDVYLISGKDTIAHKQSFDGGVVFKNLNQGEYELFYSKEGYKPLRKVVSIKEKSIVDFGDLKKEE